MGRWAQRRQAGGGQSAQQPPETTIEHATIDDTLLGIVNVFFTAPVSPADFSETDFTSQPSGTVGTVFTDLDATTLQVTFSPAIAADTSLDYAGTAPNVQTPESVLYT